MARKPPQRVRLDLNSPEFLGVFLRLDSVTLLQVAASLGRIQKLDVYGSKGLRWEAHQGTRRKDQRLRRAPEPEDQSAGLSRRGLHAVHLSASGPRLGIRMKTPEGSRTLNSSPQPCHEGLELGGIHVQVIGPYDLVITKEDSDLVERFDRALQNRGP